MRTCFDPKCATQRRKQNLPPSELAPFDKTRYTRFFRCPDCRSAYWWDGPSVLADRDHQRKRTFSDQLIPLTDAEIITIGNL